MRAFALFLLNLRATCLRHGVIAVVFSGIVLGFFAYAQPDREVLREPILIAMLGILAAMTPQAALVFSPLEDLLLKVKPLRKSLPLSSLDVAGACGAALFFPPLVTVLLGLAGIGLFFGADLGTEGLAFVALFALRMAVYGSLVSLWGFWARIRWGERAWMGNGGSLTPLLIFVGIWLSKSTWGSALLLRCFAALARPSLQWGDGLLVLLAASLLLGTALVEKTAR